MEERPRGLPESPSKRVWSFLCGSQGVPGRRSYKPSACCPFAGLLGSGICCMLLAKVQGEHGVSCPRPLGVSRNCEQVHRAGTAVGMAVREDAPAHGDVTAAGFAVV